MRSGRSLAALFASVALLAAACGRSELIDDGSFAGAGAEVDGGPDGETTPLDATFTDDTTTTSDGPIAVRDGKPSADVSVPNPCTAKCPSGCCDASGACRPGTDTNACGAAGTTCFDCGSVQESCVPLAGKGGFCAASTKCGAGNCSGCCQGDTCVDATKTSGSACGSFGQPCVVCAPGDLCKGDCSRPQTNCGPSNCKGCCRGPTQCDNGTADVACGSGGAQCARCVPTEGTGQCIANANGIGGTCTTALCGRGTCEGCCANGVCASGQTPGACGSGGMACSSCAPNEGCVAGQCMSGPLCSPKTCAGCCGGTDGNTCLTGSDVGDCGLGGFVCQNCKIFGDTCVNGTCVPPPGCSPATCHGCCYGQVCAEGDQSFLCGTGGIVCQSCDATGTQCVNGACK